jgi:hypothetical protein
LKVQVITDGRRQSRRRSSSAFLHAHLAMIPPGQRGGSVLLPGANALASTPALQVLHVLCWLPWQLKNSSWCAGGSSFKTLHAHAAGGGHGRCGCEACSRGGQGRRGVCARHAAHGAAAALGH